MPQLAPPVVLEANHAMISPRDEVLRFLPHRDRRMVGAWCFVDVYGPDDISDSAGMSVAPHPHIGLQTVSWIVQGEVLHRDTLGTTAMATPGRAAIMTAGRGIAHSENSPDEHPPVLQGAQLWVALPAHLRGTDPAFELGEPSVTFTAGDLGVQVFMGSMGGTDSGTTVFSPLLGGEVRGAEPAAGGSGTLPLDPSFEHLVVVLDGRAEVGDTKVDVEHAAFFPVGRSSLDCHLDEGARLLLLGGEPFGEEIVMWWNFVGRSHEEIVEARTAWEEHGDRFGEVTHYPTADRFEAPALPNLRLRARGAVR